MGQTLKSFGIYICSVLKSIVGSYFVFAILFYKIIKIENCNINL